MEIAVRLIGLDDGGTEESLMLGERVGDNASFNSENTDIGRFCMVCRDVRGGSYEVPQLTLATPEEKELYEIGKGLHCRFICPLLGLENIWT
jgi:hypothetical protein